ncbi:Hypothetical predicted protein [Olea europaea subsp. europaea]|uniref:Uncharacterized protein n=1 Tax=Olea europaea subsp. europaea TaxID=158383 RepID=A0A8S0PBA9_OLEEU|nr:Hypothetical predicted protein [Olea europaea subsp. europaea]
MNRAIALKFILCSVLLVLYPRTESQWAPRSPPLPVNLPPLCASHPIIQAIGIGTDMNTDTQGKDIRKNVENMIVAGGSENLTVFVFVICSCACPDSLLGLCTITLSSLTKHAM